MFCASFARSAKPVSADLPGEIAEADDGEHGPHQLQRAHPDDHPADEENDQHRADEIAINGAPAEFAIHGFNSFVDLFGVMRNPSVPCVCQSAATSSFFIAVSSAEAAGQNLLDAMDFRGHVARRDPGDLGDARGVGPFEIEQDHLPLHRLQLPDEFA